MIVSILILTPLVLASEVEQPEPEETPVVSGLINDHPVVPEPEVESLPERPWQLAEIARCESGDTHFRSDGSVILGKVNPQDVGRYQINLKYHQATAERLGLDLFDEEDNYEYALYLWKHSGARPWIHSNNCHHLLD